MTALLHQRVLFALDQGNSIMFEDVTIMVNEGNVSFTDQRFDRLKAHAGLVRLFVSRLNGNLWMVDRLADFTDEQPGQEWIDGKEAARIISKNSHHDIDMVQVSDMSNAGRITFKRDTDGHKKLYLRSDVEQIIVQHRPRQK